MTVNDFKKTMLQIDSIVWVEEETAKQIDFPNGQWKVVDAYFSSINGRVCCAVYITPNEVK